jgi:hypothetical protein
MMRKSLNRMSKCPEIGTHCGHSGHWNKVSERDRLLHEVKNTVERTVTWDEVNPSCVYKPGEVADLFRVTCRTVYQWSKTGRLKPDTQEPLRFLGRTLLEMRTGKVELVKRVKDAGILRDMTHLAHS